MNATQNNQTPEFSALAIGPQGLICEVPKAEPLKVSGFIFWGSDEYATQMMQTRETERIYYKYVLEIR